MLGSKVCPEHTPANYIAPAEYGDFHGEKYVFFFFAFFSESFSCCLLKGHLVDFGEKKNDLSE